LVIAFSSGATHTQEILNDSVFVLATDSRKHSDCGGHEWTFASGDHEQMPRAGASALITQQKQLHGGQLPKENK
jgi:hypothetical protein